MEYNNLNINSKLFCCYMNHYINGVPFVLKGIVMKTFRLG